MGFRRKKIINTLKKIFSLTSLFFIAFLILGFYLYKLQIKKHDYYFEKAQAQEEILEKSEIKRGQILITDRNANKIPIAIVKEYPIIYANPSLIEDNQKTAEILSTILKVETSTLLKKFENKKNLFKILAEKITDESLIKKIEELKIKGIGKTTKKYREYPYNSLAAQVIGFVGLNSNFHLPTGLYGIEKYYNKELESGKDIELTIDRNLQVYAEELIKNLVHEQNAENGLVIIEDPKKGEILTLANYPNFDLNKYYESQIEFFSNPAVEKIYEPGSVFKPITMAIGLENKIITPTTTYNDKGYIILNDHKITNWNKKAYGSNTTMTMIIENSINTGSVWVVQKIGRKLFYEGIKKFGFGEKTGIDLPNEVSGDLKNLEKKDAQEIDYATASFGQGIAVTPIQVINAFSAIANGGLLMRPYLNAEKEPYVIKRVISPETAKEILKMMKSAVDKAKIATIPKFQIAGKTGTSQIPKKEGGGYYEDKYIHTFVGILPVSNPQYVVLIKLEKPKSELAALSVVPAFKKMANFIINYKNLPPDDILVNQTQ